MRITCEQAALLLSARLDGEVTEQEAAALNDHLARCPECRAIAAQLEELHSAMADLEDMSAPADFTRCVMERLGEQEKPSKVVPLFRRPQFKAITGLAACALLCVGLYSAYRHPGPQPTAVSIGTEHPVPGTSPRGIPAEDPQTPSSAAVYDARTGAETAKPDESYNVEQRTEHALIALHIPEGWDVEPIGEEDCTGLRFWPKGREGAVRLCRYEQPIELGGTGLVTEPVRLPSGRVWTVGTYDGHTVWDVLYPGEELGAFLAELEPGVADWWAEYKGEALEILDSAKLEEN